MYELNNPEYLLINQNYGGHQKWLYEYGYLSLAQANHSCAISAAANYIYYLRERDGLTYPNYKRTELGFTHQMNELYQVMKPRYWGIPTAERFKKGFLKYTNSFKIKLLAKIIKTGTKDAYLDFIKDQLKKDYPVLMLTLFSKNKSVSYHWVMITAIKMSNEKVELIISNWGKKERLDYNLWFEQGYGKSLLSFNLKQEG